MSPATRSSEVLLRAAVTAEVSAVQGLAAALHEVRTCAESRDVDGLEEALEAARCSADGVSRAGAERLRRTAALARAVGVADAPTLSELVAQVGGGLAQDAAALSAQLQGVARLSAALGISARFGAASCDRLRELRRAALGLHAGYGANGRLGGAAQSLGRRA